MSRIRFYWRRVLPALLAAALLAVLFYPWEDNNEEAAEEYVIAPVDTGAALKENDTLYSEEDLSRVYTAYITVYTGIDEASGEEFNLRELNSIYGFENDPVLQASTYVVDESGHLVAGDRKGGANSTIALRGQTARQATLKSYKVKLSSDTMSFLGQSTLNLNKHVFTNIRVVQKFCYDYIGEFGHMVGMRTNFFTVYIKDGTLVNGEYEYYGFFTHTEQPNKTYLTAHGLDSNGNFYKPQDFEFFESPYIVPETDESFDGAEFAKLFKIMENADNIKVAVMLRAINNSAGAFNEVFDRYFDRDNYLTWCAMNLLFNNYDTMSRNFLLYSPSNSERWYFLPWDYDGCLISPDHWAVYEFYDFSGLQRYWGTPLHRKFFQDPDNVAMLSKRIDEVYRYLMDSDISERCEKYAEVYEKYVLTSEPDLAFIHSTAAYLSDGDLPERIRHIPQTITYYYNLYYERLKAPMPFFLGEPAAKDGGLTFNWSSSYDLQNDMLHYEFLLFSDPGSPETSAVFRGETSALTLSVPMNLEDGVYYWRVVVSDGEGNRQKSFDRLTTKEGNIRTLHIGIKQFAVSGGKLADGTTAGEE